MKSCNRIPRRIASVVAIAATMLAAAAPAARAADDAAVRDYPSRPIDLLVGFTAGGPSDAAARILAKRLTAVWPNVHVIVENRPGADGAIAAAAMTKAAPDGYTLFLATRSHVNLKWLYSGLPFDVATDFQPVAEVLTMPQVLVVGPSIKDADYAAFVQDVKAHPNGLTAFSTGNGSDPHLALALYEQKTGLKIRHVPYKGGANATVDMLAGRVDCSFATLGTVMEQIDKGQVRALAIGGTGRDPQLPNVPTFKELGVPDYSPAAWYGVVAPVGTPKGIVEKLNKAINEVMNQPEGAKALATLGALPVKVSVAQFTQQYHDDLVANGKLIKSLHIPVN